MSGSPKSSLLEAAGVSEDGSPPPKEQASLVERVRHFFLRTTGGRIIGGALAAAAIGAALFQFVGVMQADDAQWPRVRVMDPETGHLRWQRVGTGEFPYRNPKTGERSMYPVEYCFENQCGPDGGTPVVLNDYLDKEGPTICPTCGAEVVAHNPRPKGYERAIPADWKD